MHRIKFYSLNDMSIGSNLSRLLEVVKGFDPEKKDYEINEIIEFYNITIFIDNKLFSIKWSEAEVRLILDTNQLFKVIVNKYFKTITGTDIGRIFENIDWNYKDNFWEIIEKLNAFRNIHEDDFNVFLNQHNPDLRYILFNPKIVRYFDNTIKTYMMNNHKNAELLLDKFEINSENQKSMHFPSSLTINDKENLIQEYITSNNPNLNYLQLIAYIQNSKDKIIISDKIRLTTKKKIREIKEKIFTRNHGFNVQIGVSFKKQDEEIVFKSNSHSFEYSYNTIWIEQNKDYNTLLNNFIYLFEFVDLQMRTTLTNKVNEMGTLEKFIILRSTNSYKPNMVYFQKNDMANLQMISYYGLLQQMQINFEDIIEWFFHEYLFTEFNVKDYRIKTPSQESKYFEKCRSILPEMESVLKQFNLYVEDNKIDHELLQLSSEHLLFKNCKSLIEKKYIYPDSDEYNRVTFYLFSDQCMLAYVERISNKYKNFYELLRNETINVDDYPEYVAYILTWLLNKNYIEIMDHKIEFTNLYQILILKDLYYNEVINYWRYFAKQRIEIDEMLKNGLLKSESSLFSKPEQDYFNYHLNKSTFNDSLDLRNKYIHGTQPNESDDDEIHKQNYMIILKLFILIIIKINDEFCLINDIVKP